MRKLRENERKKWTSTTLEKLMKNLTKMKIDTTKPRKSLYGSYLWYHVFGFFPPASFWGNENIMQAWWKNFSLSVRIGFEIA